MLTVQYHLKIKNCMVNITYRQDTVIHKEFKYLNTRKLVDSFNGSYRTLSKLSDVNYEKVRSNPHTGKSFEIVHVFKLRPYNSRDKFKLSHEKENSEVKII